MASNVDFNASTEASDVVAAFSAQIKNKIILITGVTKRGLGGETALAIASKSPRLLVLAGRTISKVQVVMNEVAELYPSVETRRLDVDLSSKTAIKEAASVVNGYQEKHIDVLINNAGVMNIPTRTLSADGIEMHLATNWLGPFLFTNLLISKLIAAPSGARVVNVSSKGHAISPVRFSDWNFDGKELPQDEKPDMNVLKGFGIEFTPGYMPPVAYGQSKTANILHAVELTRRLKEQRVSAFSLHPGAIATDLWREWDKAVTEHIFKNLPIKSISQGVSTTLVCAFDPKLAASSGAYLEDCQVTKAAPFATDAATARKLWNLGEALSAS